MNWKKEGQGRPDGVSDCGLNAIGRNFDNRMRQLEGECDI